MEGRVFVCEWAATERGFRAWVQKRPRVAAEAATFEEADEALYEAILEAYGDGENLREYVPPRPVADDRAALRRGRLLMLGAGLPCYASNLDDLFEGGLCEQCDSPLGARTATPLRIDSSSASGDAGTAVHPRAYRGSSSRVSLSIFSEPFLALLSAGERDAFEWRPVERGKRARKRFFELIDGRTVVPPVAVRGLNGKPGWHCDVCGRVVPQFYGGNLDLPLAYVAAASLPADVPSLLAAGAVGNLSLVATSARWRELAGRKGATGIATLEVGLVDDSLIDPAPPTASLREEIAAMEGQRREFLAREARKAEAQRRYEAKWDTGSTTGGRG